MTSKKLMDLAIKARQNAYCKYSSFSVGAALLAKSGKNFCAGEQQINKTNEVASAMTYGALIYMSEKLTAIEKTMQFNANLNAVIDGILFGILEGKFKWQKL